MDDMLDDYFYPASSSVTASNLQRGHFDEYSSIYANYIVRNGDKYTIRKCLDETPITLSRLSGGAATLDFMPAKEEWRRWKKRTIQSMWKGIYIPPFLFFGDNGE
jgi:hypothetical protein